MELGKEKIVTISPSVLQQNHIAGCSLNYIIMKKRLIKCPFFSFLPLFFLINACNAQKLDVSKVPAAVKASFHNLFRATANETWEKENNNYEVNFKEGGKKLSAVIDPAGALIETETSIKTAALPSKVLDYLAVHYKGKKVKEAAVIKKANDEIVYEAEVNGKDVLFNMNGEFIKETKD
jgi:hypothetical protein